MLQRAFIRVRGSSAVLAVLFVAACAPRQVEVLSDPTVGGVATLAVSNQTDRDVMVEAQPADDPAGTFTLGVVPAQSAVAFENLPAGRLVTLRAVVVGSTLMLIGATREFGSGERAEWLLRPGVEWRTP